MRAVRRSSQVSLLVLASLLLTGVHQATAHAALRTASPAPDAQLDQAPHEIRLAFTESVEPTLSSIVVRNTRGEGATMRCEAAERNRRTCVVQLQPLASGSYTVEWRVVSADGHAVTGKYSFTIRPTPQAVAA